MQENNIRDYMTTNSVKANYAERMIRTLKHRLQRYKTHNKTNRYIDILQDTINSYNNSVHSSTNMKPIDVTEENEAALWKKLYLNNKTHNKHTKHKLSNGQQVRLVVRKSPFDKGYAENWTDAVYIVKQLLFREGIPIYKVVDLAGVPILNT